MSKDVDDDEIECDDVVTSSGLTMGRSSTGIMPSGRSQLFWGDGGGVGGWRVEGRNNEQSIIPHYT